MTPRIIKTLKYLDMEAKQQTAFRAGGLKNISETSR